MLGSFRVLTAHLSSTCRNMILDSSVFKKTLSPELLQLVSVFKKNNFEIRIAGGAVRDLLMSKIPSDVDLATTATPDEMKKILDEGNIRMINAKGEKHGTITARINDSNYEITTLRIDVVTDGRHAEVEFTKDWFLDASRRDLTINSMFLDVEGKVYDYFNGIDHLQEKKIVFVGNPSDRIREDFLRILRYFRFYGRVVDEPDQHDEEVIEAISSNVSGLKNISGERLWMELSKILQGRHACHLMKKILSVGIGPYLALPEDPDVAEMTTVYERAKGLSLHPITIICALLHTEDDLLRFRARIRLSNFERDLGLFIIKNRDSASSDLLKYKKLYYKSDHKPSDTRVYVEELLKYKFYLQLIHEFKAWEPIPFPFNGNDLKSLNAPLGRKFGVIMNKCKDYWLDHDLTPTKEDLIEVAKQAISELK